jgi:hypothetical protein
LAWNLAFAGNLSDARKTAHALQTGTESIPLLSALNAYLELVDGRYEQALKQLFELIDHGPNGKSARNRLLTGLEHFGLYRPDVPWTYYMVAQLMISGQDWPAARAAVDFFAETCQTEDCPTRIAELRSLLPLSDGEAGLPGQ